MSKIWIFDTETTSLNDDREIIEAAWIEINGDRLDSPYSEAFTQTEQASIRLKPEGPITFGAMAVHHIIPQDLEGADPSSSFSIPDDVDYLVGHNIDFDWEAAGKPDVKRIDTDAMSRYIWPDADSHSQSALLYMALEPSEGLRDLLLGAHSAMIDAQNNLSLLREILVKRTMIKSWEELWQYSEDCRVPIHCPFQKHKGEAWEDVAFADPGFCEWVLRQDWVDEYTRIAVERAMGYDDELEEEEHDLQEQIPF